MKVIVIGGGIGGLMTAISLLENGHEVLVFEQAPTLREVGAGLWIAPNALAVLQKFGLAQKIIQQGRNLAKASVIDTDGNLITMFDFVRIKRKYGFGNVAIHRATLQKILLESIPNQALKTGKQFSSFEQDESSVTARFNDGTYEVADLLIGADGIHSNVRKQLYPHQELRDSHQSCWRIVVEHPLPTSEQDNMYEIWSKKEGLRFGYSYINDKEVYCYVTSFRPGQHEATTINAKHYLLQLCQSFSEPVIELITSAEDSQILLDRLYDLPFNKKWYSGRVALLGDAVHASTPNLGQGACQAIEDAYALSLCLSNGDKIETAFKRYESLRRPKAEYISRTSWKLSQITNMHGWIKQIAISLMKITPSFIMDRQYDKMYSIDNLEAQTKFPRKIENTVSN